MTSIIEFNSSGTDGEIPNYSKYDFTWDDSDDDHKRWRSRKRNLRGIFWRETETCSGAAFDRASNICFILRRQFHSQTFPADMRQTAAKKKRKLEFVLSAD